MDGISTPNDVKRNKGHLFRYVVRWEGIIFMIGILFLAPDPTEVAKHMQPESGF